MRERHVLDGQATQKREEKTLSDFAQNAQGQDGRPDPSVVEKLINTVLRQTAVFADRVCDERVTPLVLGLEGRSPFRLTITSGLLRAAHGGETELRALRQAAQIVVDTGLGQAMALEAPTGNGGGDSARLWVPKQRLDFNQVGSRLAAPLMSVETVIDLIEALTAVAEPFSAMRREIQRLSRMARFPVPVRIAHQDVLVSFTNFGDTLDMLGSRLERALEYAADVELGSA